MCQWLTHSWFHDVAVGVSALGVLLLGIFGYNQWKKEYTWKTSREIIQRGIKIISTLQDNMVYARSCEYSEVDDDAIRPTHSFDLRFGVEYNILYPRYLTVKSSIADLKYFRQEIKSLSNSKLEEQIISMLSAGEEYLDAFIKFFELKKGKSSKEELAPFQIIICKRNNDEYGKKFEEMSLKCLDYLKKIR